MMFCKPWSSRGHSHERMGRGGKVTPQVTPQVTLSFAPGRPPIFDRSPAKPPNISSSWSGQMWSHLTNMFTSPPTVQWVNPNLVRECPPPSLVQYDGYCPYAAVPCTTMDPGGGLWHPAPPGNLQQQQMMEPLQMLQANTFIPVGKMDTHNAFPGGKMDTHNAFPGGKIDPSNVFLNSKPVSPVYPSKVPTKRLNPNAQEWVPREYRTSLPSVVSTTSTGHVAVEEMPCQNHLTPTPGISYTPQEFCEITEEEVKEVRENLCPPPPPPAVLPPPGTGSLRQCQNMVPQFSANNIPVLESDGMCGSVMCLTPTHLEGSTKEVNPVQSSHSVSPCCWESSASKVVMCEESERGSGGQSCESCLFTEQCVLGSSGQCGEPWSLLPSTESNRPGQEALCPSSKNSESPQEATPGTSERSASPDQVEHSTTLRPDSPATPSPTQTADSSSESCRLSSEWLSSSPTCPRRSTSPGKGMVARLEVPPAQSVVVNATEDAGCSNHKCPSPAEAPASILCPEDHQRVPDKTTGSNSATLSYAGVLARSSPSPPPPTSSPEQLKYKGVEQPLPKIFQREETPPREPVVSRVGTERRMPELFRRPTKTQRTQSRKFLEELKELGLTGGGDDIVGCGSSPSSISSSPPSFSSDSDLSQSPDVSPMPSSPFHAIPSLPMSPSRCSLLVARSSPQTIAIPIPPCGANPGQLESPGSKTQSSSVSSTASLDIEFVEQDEVDLAPSIDPPCSSRKASDSLGARNGFLACILGSGDSDSEEEDDWDADWDEVCVAESNSTPGLDDSWETFGLGLVVVDCRMESSEEQRAQCRVEEPKTEECGGIPHLAEINKRWEEEVRRDVKGKSTQQVRFSGEKIHPMVVWGHAYREARRGPWEQQARDRARFAQRIATLEPALSQVLEPSHRRAVYHRLHAPTPPTRCFL